METSELDIIKVKRQPVPPRQIVYYLMELAADIMRHEKGDVTKLELRETWQSVQLNLKNYLKWGKQK